MNRGKTVLSNKRILVPGAGGLLGCHLVETLLANGARVVAADANVESTRARLQDKGVNLASADLSVIQLDVTNEEAVKALFSEFAAYAEEDRIDGAVNCTYPRNKQYGRHFFDVTLADFNENVSMHLGSSFLLMQQCALLFKQTEHPFSLVNISSIYGVIAPKFEIYDGTPMTVPVEYSAIKSAILLLSQYAANYINDSRFRVNSMSPGGLLDQQPESFLEAYKAQTHGKGMLDADDVTGTIVYLLSDLSKYVTGQNIVVDAGFSI